tara:strand:+ start:525 stop:695 length:171 start_codon:yes stop_codon:yes gene_type:complete
MKSLIALKWRDSAERGISTKISDINIVNINIKKFQKFSFFLEGWDFRVLAEKKPDR